MELLTNVVRPYAWGSRTAIAAVQSRPMPTRQPEAELWMGTHPGAPSRLIRAGVEHTLADLIRADPDAEVGPEVVREHGRRLPFLVKLLAADSPLSIQVHPDADQASAGYVRAEAAGIPRSDPRRSYVDPYHKPELLCAVSEFEALCGFREVAESAKLLGRLDCAALAPYAQRLQAEPDERGLRTVFTALMTSPADARSSLVAEVVAACADAVARSAPGASEYGLTVALSQRYPGDIGAVVALLLNRLRLCAGEALFIPPGRPHTYLRGVGVEVMACSDNVIRGGLTPKHTDVPELLRVIRYEPGAVEPMAYAEPAPGVQVWTPPVREFVLSRVALPDARGATVRLAPAGPAAGSTSGVVPPSGPRILFCLSGTVLADDGLDQVKLTGGDAAFVPAGPPAVTLTGDGIAFHVTTAPAFHVTTAPARHPPRAVGEP